MNVNGSLTDVSDCRVGARQADNLSPLLFIIFMNDFEIYVSSKMQSITPEDSNLQTFLKLYKLLYADDTLLFGENETDLQDAVDATMDYCRNVCINIS